MSALTPAQAAAVAANGNVLVEAAAGAGKTKTLVARCLDRVLSPVDPVPLDQILMVTFTEAAAAEMRKRIRAELERRLVEQPANEWLQEQLATLEHARIGTLHSFCLQLVRGHFYELGLDPQLVVLDDAQSKILAAETMNGLLERHYAGVAPGSLTVQELIQAHGRGQDDRIRGLVRRLHEYSQTLVDAAGWLENQLALWRQPVPTHWLSWLAEGLIWWRDLWLPVLEGQPPENANAAQCAAWLRGLTPGVARARQAELLAQIAELEATDRWPKKTLTKFRKPLEKFFEEAAFLRDLAETREAVDPLQEDWGWVQPHMVTLLELAREFGAAFAHAKRELAGLDFHDLEQFSLRLLWDAESESPTLITREWRRRLRLVFVDEYQDINAAQDRIISALSGEGEGANRFLVGDVKQSIYRFRLANPAIFLDYSRCWRELASGAQVITLAENFRSHEALLEGINGFFRGLMRPEIGGLSYGETEALRFGAPEARAEVSIARASDPRVEFLLRVTTREESESSEADAADDSTAAEKEARMVARRLLELFNAHFPVWDDELKAPRPVMWRDMVVLLRSPRSKAESFAKEFARLGVPLAAERGGFFEATEVSDFVSLLRLLDNPLQDVPLLAVLRSPLAGLTLDELAVIRLALRKGAFWWALQKFHQSSSPVADDSSVTPVDPAFNSARAKVSSFLHAFAAWRRLARRGSLSQCLETVLDETGYEDWLAAQPRGPQRRANLQRLLFLARQFDRWQGQGLFRFLRSVDAGEEAGIEPESAGLETANTVRLLSIHQSKGLEFPVVVAADLAKKFNLDDLKADLILDEYYGICPQIKPPHTGSRYPSLPWWLASRRQRAGMLGEEIRLLYVAFTRARDYLILSGSIGQEALEKKCAEQTAATLPTPRVLAANSALDWLAPLFGPLSGVADWWQKSTGQGHRLAWRLCGADVAETVAPAGELTVVETAPGMEEAIAALRDRLAWEYPFVAATCEPAKTSVTALRRRAPDESDDEARPLFRPGRAAKPAQATARLAISAAQIGTLHHRFLQHVNLAAIVADEPLADELARLQAGGVFTPDESAALDLEQLSLFWRGRLGQRILAEAPNVERELPFTGRFSPAELVALGIPVTPGLSPDDYVVTQGIVDLAVIRERELWLVDFKTDAISPRDLRTRAEIYAPQIKLYAIALERIYRRPVTERWLHFLHLGKSVAVE